MFSVEFIKEMDKICSILESCETIDQLDNAYKWGCMVLNRKINYANNHNAPEATYCEKGIVDTYIAYLTDKYEVMREKMIIYVTV